MLNPGEIIGKRYQIVNTLGQGGFGITYLVQDITRSPQLRFVAKQLQPQGNTPMLWQKAKERFAQEAIMLQRLGVHDQIPQLIEYFEENQDFYLIQEFIDGEELRREVSRHRLNESEVVAFLTDALTVLDFVHKHNVIHRDIKPSNLLRRRSDGRIVLIDFGAVKELGSYSVSQEELPGDPTSAIGSPGYMPLEQQGGRPTLASDIYALGQTALFAVTGKTPLERSATATSQNGILPTDIPVSPALFAILMGMTELNTDLRYSSTEDVLNDLKPLQKVGKTLGDRYQLLEYLGGQGWTHSYRARSQDLIAKPELSKFCVVKQMKPEVEAAITPQTVQQCFEQLASILQPFGSNPQIPRCLAQFESEGDRFWVEEYVEGQSLAQILQSQKNLSESNVIQLLQELLEVLALIHQKNLIHQDIRPAHLIWLDNQKAKVLLIHLGWHTVMEPVFPFSNITTSQRDSLGNEGYQSPEQRAGNPSVASDLYALGITAIQSLRGEPPDRFPRDPQTNRLCWQNGLMIEPQLASILDKLVEEDCNQRYSSATEALKDVRQLNRHYHPVRLSPWQRFGAIGLGVGGVLAALVYINQVSYTIGVLQNADDFLKNKDYKNAIKLYEEGLANPPPLVQKIANFEKAWIQKAFALSALKRYPETLKACESAALIDPMSPHPYICKGTALDEMGKPDLAIKSYDRAIALSPNLYEAWQGRGHSYWQLAHLQNAIADFQKAIALGKDKAAVTWNDLGSLYFNAKNPTKAIEAYQKAINLASNYLPPRIGLGNAFLARRKYQEALTVFRQALALDPKSYEAWYGKALVEERLRQHQAALSSYQQALILKPNSQVALAARQRVSRHVK